MRLATVVEIQERLMIVFPDGTAQRNYLTREMAARTVFVCLYAGAIEGNDCWIRPNQVCRMTDAQAARTDTASRETWCRDSARGGFTPPVGTPGLPIRPGNLSATKPLARAFCLSAP